MATIADLLGDKAQPLQAVVKGQRSNNTNRMHAVAAATAIPGCPLKRDSNGRLRQSGRFVSVK